MPKIHARLWKRSLATFASRTGWQYHLQMGSCALGREVFLLGVGSSLTLLESLINKDGNVSMWSMICEPIGALRSDSYLNLPGI
jgi:hypothetical protein